MKFTGSKIVILVLAAFLGLYGCSGGGQQDADKISPDSPVVHKSEKNNKLTPEDMGQKIADIYIAAMKEVVDLLGEKPETSLVKAQLEEIKERYVQELVALGKQRELLDDSGKSALDSKIQSKLYSFYKDPLFTKYNELQQFYFQDRDFHKVLISFNIITQYSIFELLKKQEPEEAVRLGIE